MNVPVNIPATVVISIFAGVGSVLAFVDATYLRESVFSEFKEDYQFGLALKIKEQIRELRRGPQNQYTQEDIERLIDKLCQLSPANRECK
jgi:hypothetical protein